MEVNTRHPVEDVLPARFSARFGLKSRVVPVFWVLIIVIIPFVMGIYFGLAAIICNEIVAAGRPILPLEPLSWRTIVLAAVTYIGLSAWVWLRWRKLIPKGR